MEENKSPQGEEISEKSSGVEEHQCYNIWEKVEHICKLPDADFQNEGTIVQCKQCETYYAAWQLNRWFTGLSWYKISSRRAKGMLKRLEKKNKTSKGYNEQPC